MYCVLVGVSDAGEVARPHAPAVAPLELRVVEGVQPMAVERFTGAEAAKLASLMQDIDRVLQAIASRELLLNVVDAELSNLETSALADSPATSSSFRAEVRRHIRQTAMVAGIDLGDTVVGVERRYTQARDQGFRDFMHRATVTLIFARFAVWRGSDLALHAVLVLRDELQGTPAATRDTTHRHAATAVRKFISELADDPEFAGRLKRHTP